MILRQFAIRPEERARLVENADAHVMRDEVDKAPAPTCMPATACVGSAA